jgi:hypothetical protein
VINACCLEQKEVRGTLTLPQEISSQAKQNDTTRSQYDHEIKSALVGNFVGAEGLKAESEIPPSQILTPRQATAKLEEILTSAKTPEQIENSLKDMYVKVSFQETDELAAQQGVQTKVLSGQMFFKMYVESLNAELSNLEAACPQGYVFTVDPPSIFASCFSDGPNQKNPTAMNRFQMLALKYLSLKQTSAGAPVPFPHMKSFGFNNFADPNAPALYASFLGERARTKASLFSSPSGQYTPPVGQESCALVIHNNSDGYGNNIENESGGGSMDAVIGQYSSAAATLAQAGLAPARPEIPPQPGRLASGLTLGSSVPKTPAPATPALAPKPSAVAEKVSTPTPQQITPSAVQPAAAQPLPQVLGEERKSMAGVMLRDLALFKNAKQKIADQESGLTFIQAATHPDVLVVEGFKDSNIISIGIRHGPDGSVASARATVRNQQGQREEIDLNGELPKSVHDAFFRAMVKQEGPQTFPSVAGRPLTPQEQAVAQQIAQVPEKTKLGASLAYTSGAEIESKGGILLTPTKNPAEFYEGIAVMPDPAGGYRLHLCPGGGYQEFDMQKINELMKQAVATAFQKGITITSYEGSVGRHSGATKANFQQWQKSPLQETPPPVTPTGAQQIPSSAVQPAGVQGPQIPQATMPPVIPAGAQYIQPSAVPPAAAQGPQIPQATMPPVIPTGVQYIMPSAVPPAGVQGPQPFSSVAGPLMSQEQAFTYQIAHAPMRRNPAVTVVLAKGADIINQGPDQLNGILLTVPPNNDLNVPYEGIAVVPDPDVAGGYRLHICLGAKPEFDRQKINELMMEAVATAAQQGVNITSFDPSMGRHGSRPTLENFMKWQADNWAVPS